MPPAKVKNREDGGDQEDRHCRHGVKRLRDNGPSNSQQLPRGGGHVNTIKSHRQEAQDAGLKRLPGPSGRKAQLIKSNHSFGNGCHFITPFLFVLTQLAFPHGPLRLGK
ncbi:MAG: hypothetical protein V3U14_06280 [candidate division NC10 bacterium]